MFCVEFHYVKCGPLVLQELLNEPTCIYFGLVPASVQEGSLQPTGFGQSVSSVNQTSGWHVTPLDTRLEGGASC